MFDRIGLAGHLFRLAHRPHDLAGDRWGLVGIVLNLTGFPDSSRRLLHAGAEWTIVLRERNLADCDAMLAASRRAGRSRPPSASVPA